VLGQLVTIEAIAATSSGLFPRLKGRGAAQATVPVEIRLHAGAAAVLDDLVKQTGAESRTQLDRAQPQLPRLSMALTSSSVSSTRAPAALASIRSRRTDLGITTKPCATCHATIT
jgi:hypothetical protein